MGTIILRGISSALVATVLTILAGMIWNVMGFGGLSVSNLVDIGLAVSCLFGGFRAGRESGQWFLGGVTGAGYVIVGVLLLALFAPVRTLGVFQVLAEGALLGSIAGAFAAGGAPVSRRRPLGQGRWASGRSYGRDNIWAEEKAFDEKPNYDKVSDEIYPNKDESYENFSEEEYKDKNGKDDGLYDRELPEEAIVDKYRSGNPWWEEEIGQKRAGV